MAPSEIPASDPELLPFSRLAAKAARESVDMAAEEERSEGHFSRDLGRAKTWGERREAVAHEAMALANRGAEILLAQGALPCGPLPLAALIQNTRPNGEASARLTMGSGRVGFWPIRIEAPRRWAALPRAPKPGSCGFSARCSRAAASKLFGESAMALMAKRLAAKLLAAWLCSAAPEARAGAGPAAGLWAKHQADTLGKACPSPTLGEPSPGRL